MRDTAAIQRVLIQVLALNLVVAAAKLALGATIGSLSMIADGFHSLADGTSNVVGLIGTRIAARPADPDHPYGHQKFETLAALLIGALVALTAWEILESAVDRLLHGGTPDATMLSFAVMAATMLTNVAVTTYETRQARKLKSEVLLADALQTRSDIFVSLGVIVSLAASRLGYPIFDVATALFITCVIAWSAYQILRHSADALLDAAAVDPEHVRRVVEQVPGVESSHKIRTRGGGAGGVYADLHIQVPATLRLDQAHIIGHLVEEALHDDLGLTDVVVHVEPPVGHRTDWLPDDKGEVRTGPVPGRDGSGTTERPASEWEERKRGE
ncbi:MAG TPA: cation diffusion facilitator family transporter [Ardenticatenaceae bacterium]|nr:cation diffusion facilitator family transporter [Ardenticatenaceae bacterium]